MNCPIECSTEPPNLFLPASQVRKITDHYNNREVSIQSDWQGTVHSNVPQLHQWSEPQANDFEPHIQTKEVSSLEVNDAVKVGSSYGTIKYIGELPGYKEKMAGVEMV